MNRVNLWWRQHSEICHIAVMSIILNAKSQWSICRSYCITASSIDKEELSSQQTGCHPLASLHTDLNSTFCVHSQCPVFRPADAFSLSDSGCCCVKKNILCSQKKYSSSQQLYDECLTLCWCFKYFIFARNAFEIEIKENIHNEFLWKEYNTEH